MVHTISTSDITMVLWYIVWYCIVHSMVPQTYHGTYPSTSDITMVHSAVKVLYGTVAVT